MEKNSSSETIRTNFPECLSADFGPSDDVIHLPTNSSYSSLLESTVQNKRFLGSSSYLRPLAIVKASTYDHVQATVKRCKQHGVSIRTRAGGHDYEGLSYRSRVPFLLLDLQLLNAVDVNVEENSAWVQAGATLGELYFWIVQKSSSLGFSAGICPTVGTGGHFSGGGYGTVSRNYGLAADNVVDALMVAAKGQILDRESMGEDLFWAIRGGGGASFGVILAWNVKLVEVPSIVTVFRVNRTLEQGGTNLVQKWQTIANKLNKDLFMRSIITRASNKIQTTFETLYLGRADQLLAIINQDFPDLGLKKEDCIEMSWIESVLYIANRDTNDIDGLKNRVPDPATNSKATSDYVTWPLSVPDLEMLWKWCLEEENPILILEPYGGLMDEISSSTLPFPHRKDVLYNIQYLVEWDDVEDSEVHINWITSFYERMKPYVSKCPRRAYLNYRDLDLGVNNVDGGIYSEAKEWGTMYFGQNFQRLCYVKGMVDPENFFKDEQSIPPL